MRDRQGRRAGAEQGRGALLGETPQRILSKVRSQSEADRGEGGTQRDERRSPSITHQNFTIPQVAEAEFQVDIQAVTVLPKLKGEGWSATLYSPTSLGLQSFLIQSPFPAP